MEIIFHTIDDADNVINKNLNPLLTLQITLKNNQDIVNPVLVLQDNGNYNFPQYNYLEIADLGRLYFIDEVESMGNNLFRVRCRCDVLESFKGEIESSEARLTRNIQQGDYYRGSLDVADTKSLLKFTSNKGMSGKHSLILTSIGAE